MANELTCECGCTVMAGVEIDAGNNTMTFTCSACGREIPMELAVIRGMANYVYEDARKNDPEVREAVRKLIEGDPLGQHPQGMLEYKSPRPAHSETTDLQKVGQGRNDRCACGSGKKFKKCCLHR